MRKKEKVRTPRQEYKHQWYLRNKKSKIVSQLAATNAIARTKLLTLFNNDYKDVIRRKKQEDLEMQKLQEMEQERLAKNTETGI
jgi:hypothetical protein